MQISGACSLAGQPSPSFQALGPPGYTFRAIIVPVRLVSVPDVAYVGKESENAIRGGNGNGRRQAPAEANRLHRGRPCPRAERLHHARLYYFYYRRPRD